MVDPGKSYTADKSAIYSHVAKRGHQKRRRQQLDQYAAFRGYQRQHDCLDASQPFRRYTPAREIGSIGRKATLQHNAYEACQTKPSSLVVTSTIVRDMDGLRTTARYETSWDSTLLSFRPKATVLCHQCGHVEVSITTEPDTEPQIEDGYLSSTLDPFSTTALPITHSIHRNLVECKHLLSL